MAIAVYVRMHWNVWSYKHHLKHNVKYLTVKTTAKIIHSQKYTINEHFQSGNTKKQGNHDDA